MSLFLSCIFCSTVIIRKNVLQKEIKDWTYKAYLVTEETSSWFPLIESLIVVLEFLSNGESLNCFSWYVLPRLSKVTVTCPQSVKKNKPGQFWLAQSKQNKYQLWNAQSQQNDQFEISISPVTEKLETKFGQQVNIIERVPFGTPPQAVVIPLAHNHMTNPFISSYRGATVIRFGQ